MVLGAIGQGATIAITIRAIDKFSNTFRNADKGIGLLGKSMKIGAAAVATVGVAMVSVGVKAIKLAADFEQTTVAFTTMLGSGEKAKVFLEDLADFAKKTPFTLQGVEKSARQLLAVGFEAKDVLPVLKDVGNVAAGLGLGEPGLERLILNLGQVQSQGKLTGRELRDFAVAGIPMLEELSKELGVSTKMVQEMVSKGAISTDLVLKAFNNMSSEGGRFANLMEKQAKTVEGRFSNLKDTVTLLGRDMGATLLPVVSDLADVFLNDVLPSIKPLIPLIGDFLKTALEKIAPFLPRLVDGFMRFVEFTIRLFDAIGPLLGPLADLAFVLFDGLMDILEPLLPIVEVFAQLLGDNLRIALTILKPALRLMTVALTLLLKVLEPVVNALSKVFTLINKLSGGYIGRGLSKFNEFLNIDEPKPIQVNRLPTSSMFTGTSRGTINFNVEGNLIGLNENAMSRALADELNNKVSI